MSNYYTEFDNDVKIKIYGQNGKDISKISGYGKVDEQEILFNRNSKYKIVGKKETFDTVNKKHRLILTLAEV